MQRSARVSRRCKKSLRFNTKSSQSVIAVASALRSSPSRTAISPKISPALIMPNTISLPSSESELILMLPRSTAIKLWPGDPLADRATARRVPAQSRHVAQQPRQHAARSRPARAGAGGGGRGGRHPPRAGRATAQRVPAGSRYVAHRPRHRAERSRPARAGAECGGRGSLALPRAGRAATRRVPARSRPVAQREGEHRIEFGNFQRNLISRSTLRILRAEASAQWQDAVAAA